MPERVLAAIAGLGGSIGTTIATGVGCRHAPELTSLGRVTRSSEIEKLALDLPSLDEIIITGWDLEQQPLSHLAAQHGICHDSILALAQTTLTELAPRPPFQSSSLLLGSWIRAEARFLEDLARKNQASVIVLLNLCPTEPQSSQVDDGVIPWKDLNLLLGSEPGITASRIYFRLAIEARAHFINFTPNLAETASLARLASEQSICFCGRDGKTGQTFLKSVLAPAFRDRNLRVDGWFSTNLLGNADGKTLASPDTLVTKTLSKSTCLPAILGYHPGGSEASNCHQVHIHYYPPHGDSKEAWDNIDFTGFLGGRMQLKLNFLVRDSILAAPLAIDLIFLMARAGQRGHVGYLPQLNYFFKFPVDDSNEHAASRQFLILTDFLKSLAPERQTLLSSALCQ